MNAEDSRERLWAGISGIPFSCSSGIDGFTLRFNGTASLFGKVNEAENMVNFSVLNSVLSEISRSENCEGIETVPQSAVDEALSRNSRIEGARCKIAGKLLLTDSDGITYETGTEISFSRSRDSEFAVSLMAKGITACPCSMGKIRKMLEEKYPGHSKSISEVPQITHNQRVGINVSARFNRTEKGILKILFNVCRMSIGNVLSHNQSETEVNRMLLEAHESPLLIEDVARKGAENAKKMLGLIPSSVDASVVCESEESIHSYNAKAEKLILF